MCFRVRGCTWGACGHVQLCKPVGVCTGTWSVGVCAGGAGLQPRWQRPSRQLFPAGAGTRWRKPFSDVLEWPPGGAAACFGPVLSCLPPEAGGLRTRPGARMLQPTRSGPGTSVFSGVWALIKSPFLSTPAGRQALGGWSGLHHQRACEGPGTLSLTSGSLSAS